jgi:uracil-DNA glycosylase family 4
MLTEIDILNAAMRECKDCPLCENRTQVVCGRGFVPRKHKETTKLLIIGEAPGEDEDYNGEPFIGRSGYVLEMWLSWLGLDDETDWHITNLVKCRPPKNRDPKPNEIKVCTENWLIKEIKYLKPWVIMPVGRHASSYFLGSKYKIGITNYRGQFYLTPKQWVENSLDKKRRVIYPVIHPSWYIRKGQGEKEEAWSEQLTNLQEYLIKRNNMETQV